VQILASWASFVCLHACGRLACAALLGSSNEGDAVVHLRAGSFDFNLYGVDGQTGDIKWTYSMGKAIQVRGWIAGGTGLESGRVLVCMFLCSSPAASTPCPFHPTPTPTPRSPLPRNRAPLSWHPMTWSSLAVRTAWWQLWTAPPARFCGRYVYEQAACHACSRTRHLPSPMRICTVP
jgi:hypothetical protein